MLHKSMYVKHFYGIRMFSNYYFFKNMTSNFYYTYDPDLYWEGRMLITGSLDGQVVPGVIEFNSRDGMTYFALQTSRAVETISLAF